MLSAMKIIIDASVIIIRKKRHQSNSNLVTRQDEVLLFLCIN